MQFRHCEAQQKDYSINADRCRSNLLSFVIASPTFRIAMKDLHKRTCSLQLLFLLKKPGLFSAGLYSIVCLNILTNMIHCFRYIVG